MDPVLEELDNIPFQDLSLLFRAYKSHNILDLANVLLSTQKAHFTNSQVAFIKESLPDIVKQAQLRKDQDWILSPEFLQALLLQINQFDPKMSKQDKKILKTALESNFPQDMEQYMKLFEIFTESQDRDWLVSRYISGGIRLIEDINSRAKPAIVAFKKFVKQGYLSGDLSQFATLPELEKAIEPFLEKQELTNKGQSDIVYDDPQFRVIELHDQTAACYYGQGTKWCTAATKGDNRFNSYKKDGPIFVLLIKTPRYKGEKYQFRFFPEFFITDEKDEEIILEEMQDIFPHITTILEKLYVKIMTEPEKIGFLKSAEIMPHLIINNDGNIYFKDKWLLIDYNFILFNTTKYIISVDSNPDNLPELTTNDDINTFRNTDYTHLIFERNFDQLVDNLPKNLTHLTFGYNFNQPVDNLPQNLTHLTFGYKFNQPVDRLPQNLTHLTFGSKFNQPVNYLPPNLTNLTFGTNFNQRVNHLPQNITHLTFGYLFNQSVKHLPPNLTHLSFGAAFNKRIDNLPKNLTHLTFGYKFNQPINKLLKNLINLTNLTFGKEFNQRIEHLPPNVNVKYLQN